MYNPYSRSGLNNNNKPPPFLLEISCGVIRLRFLLNSDSFSSYKVCFMPYTRCSYLTLSNETSCCTTGRCFHKFIHSLWYLSELRTHSSDKQVSEQSLECPETLTGLGHFTRYFSASQGRLSRHQILKLCQFTDFRLLLPSGHGEMFSDENMPLPSTWLSHPTRNSSRIAKSSVD